MQLVTIGKDGAIARKLGPGLRISGLELKEGEVSFSWEHRFQQDVQELCSGILSFRSQTKVFFERKIKDFGRVSYTTELFVRIESTSSEEMEEVIKVITSINSTGNISFDS